MGSGYIIRCDKCILENDEKSNGARFDILLGCGMLCFCKEQIEKIYGLRKNCDRKYRLLAGGDPSDEIYTLEISPIKDNVINSLIFENIRNGYEFKENFEYKPYHCDNCKQLFSRFYFQMKKDKIIFTPKYHCEYCNGILKPVKIRITENESVEIKYYNETKILLCKNCNNTKFKVLTYTMWD